MTGFTVIHWIKVRESMPPPRSLKGRETYYFRCRSCRAIYVPPLKERGPLLFLVQMDPVSVCMTLSFVRDIS